MEKYKKKPLIIEAEIFYQSEMPSYVIRQIEHVLGFPTEKFFIETLEGPMQVKNGDYIIKGIKGELYPCRKDIFNESYEKVNEE